MAGFFLPEEDEVDSLWLLRLAYQSEYTIAIPRVYITPISMTFRHLELKNFTPGFMLRDCSNKHVKRFFPSQTISPHFFHSVLNTITEM